MPEKDYTYNQQLLLEGVKSTWGIPTVAFSVLGVTAGFFVLPALRLSWETLLATPEQVGEILDNAAAAAADAVKAELIAAAKPFVKFKLDVSTCMKGALVGKVWVPVFSDGNFHACMSQKGYAGDIIAGALTSLSKARFKQK